ncbi:DUF3267 domain-containing protein [Luteococcus peritonei]|uniref:DUF3267 domain-containing protein n=1 Tax=Luteococcus peritonei TaxID=88874 RepID=A0ABW4S0G7_9ACTN
MTNPDPRPATAARPEVVGKTPGERSQAWMAALATGLLLGGAAVGIALLDWQGIAEGTVVIDARRVLRMVLGTTVMTVATLAVHELLHGLGMLAVGARPRFGAGVMSPSMPYLYTTSEGHLFTRTQFIAIAALPNVVINIALLAMIAFGDDSAWFVVPFAMHLSGGVGDAWLCWAAAAEAPGNLIEDQGAGIGVVRPPGWSPAQDA